MDDKYYKIVGFLSFDGNIDELRNEMRQCNLTPSTADTHHFNIEECGYFRFRELSEDKYSIEGDATTIEKMRTDVSLVVSRFDERNLSYDIELYDPDENLLEKFEARKERNDR